MIFILIFAAILGLLNLYAYHAIAPAAAGWSTPLAILFAILYASPFVAAYLERKERPRLAAPLSNFGFNWLGVIGIAVTFASAIDLLQLALPRLDDVSGARIVVVATTLVALYGAIAARRPRLVSIPIRSDKIRTPAESPFRLVQISDLHLGDSATLPQLDRIIARIEALQPDIIVSTGDLFDGFLALMEPYAERFLRLQPPLGKFAISGNHEVFAGLERAMELTEDAGFQLLRNAHCEVSDWLTIAGVEDPMTPAGSDDKKALPGVAQERFTVLLKHRPSVDKATLDRFDLQLSGHTHGGQIFPFVLLTKLQYRARIGLSTVGPNGQQLYLSRGTGSWGPQIRWLAPPEITLFELSS